MADMIRVDPANLREAASKHTEAAEYLRGVPAQHAAIQESLDSLGPIFGKPAAGSSNSDGCATTGRPTTMRSWPTI